MANANSNVQSVPVTVALEPPVVLLGPGGDFVRPWPDPMPTTEFDCELHQRQYRADLYSVHARARRRDEKRRRLVLLFFAASASLMTLVLAVNLLGKGGVM